MREYFIDLGLDVPPENTLIHTLPLVCCETVRDVEAVAAVAKQKGFVIVPTEISGLRRRLASSAPMSTSCVPAG
jgi:hypothetical protein